LGVILKSKVQYNWDMLPRIVVWRGLDREEVHRHLNVKDNCVVLFEGSEANVKDFRRWVISAIDILGRKPEYSGIIWDAHKLSWECQAVLLKPLEELDQANIVLVTEAENLLAETILSRCVVESLATENVKSGKYWSRVLTAWKEGPASCIALSDELSQDEALELSEEIGLKIRGLLRDKANPKRVEVLKGALLLMEEMRAKNLNVKLCLGEFLLKGWRATKLA